MKQILRKIFSFSGHTSFFAKSAGVFTSLIFLSTLVFTPLSAHSSENFPVYQGIKKNVRFWEDIYSRYTTRQGVLHDRDNLDLVYTVVDLVDWDTKGSARINKKLIKLARQHYKAILAELASGKKPVTQDEKRVAAMFAGKSHQAMRKARDNIRLQVGQSDRFLEGFVRSGSYMPAIKKIFMAYKLPQELAYLPHVESSFNTEARSKAGAAGLWQFTRSTGRQYMRVDNVIDLRYDPYYSTKAAAIFLKENFDILGSWPLAITAYNHGRNGMQRAMKKYGSYELIFKKHKTRQFSFASRNFYSEFIAAINVAHRLEKNKSVIPDRPEASIMVRMEGFTRAEDIRTHFHLSEEDFTRLNPALEKSVLTGKKLIPNNFYIRVPANPRTRDLASRIPSDIYHTHQIRDREYIVQRGDTVGAIARRYSIPINELIMANNLNRRAMIRIGQKMKIPAKAGSNKNDRVVTFEARSKNKPD